MALGASHLAFRFRNNGSGGGDGSLDKAKEFHVLTLSQSNRAITRLLEQFRNKNLAEKSSQPAVTILTTCAILVFVAISHDDLAAAHAHITYGLKAIKEWEKTNFDNSPVGPFLHRVLFNLHLKYQVCCNPVLYMEEPPPAGAAEVGNYEFKDRTILAALVNFWDYWMWQISQPHVLGFSMGSIHVDSCPPIHSIHSLDIGTMFKVLRWRRLLEGYFQQQLVSLQQPSLHDLSTLLGIWFQVFCIKVATEKDPACNQLPFEMRYDGFRSYFQRANELANKLLLSLIQQGISKPTFPVNKAIIMPLFYCGFHCRDWSIRRETLGLLREWEGRFTAPPLPSKSSVLERLIDVESEGLRPGDMVPESARIHYVCATMRPGSEEAHLSCISPVWNGPI